MGKGSMRLIHGRGHGHGLSPGFINTNTGHFGVQIRRELQCDRGPLAMDQAQHARLQRRWVDGREAQTKPEPDAN